MSGAEFPVPPVIKREAKSVFPIGYEEKLKITLFDTIKGDYFDEISIGKFFDKIEKGINKCPKYYAHDGFGFYICYDTNVYKIEDNHYMVSFRNKEKNEYKDYHIYTEEYQKYNVIFDKYAEITDGHEYERECYRKIENNEECSISECRAYLDYLNKIKTCCNSSLLKKILSILAGPAAIIGGTLSANFGVPFGVGIFTALTIIAFVKMTDIFYDAEMYHIGGKSYTNTVGLSISTRHRRMINKRIKQMEKKLGKEYQKQKREKINVDYNIAQETNEIVSEKKEYSDPIINEISKMKKQADVLSNENRAIVFSMMESLVDEYLARVKEINSEKSNGLLFDGDEIYNLRMEIAKNELTNIQQKINYLLKMEEKNKKAVEDANNIKKEMAESLTNGEAVAMGGVMTKTR